MGIRRPSSATVIASIALFVALGGTGIAAASKLLPANSVASGQIVNHSIKKVDLGVALPRGPRGLRGAQGSEGPAGDRGPVGISTVGSATGTTGAMCAFGGGSCQVGTSVATCPTGSVVVGGGYSTSSTDVVVSYLQRTSGTTYNVIAINYTGTPETIAAQAVCAFGPGVGPSLRSDAAQTAFQKALTRVRGELAH
jgi:hypothetical protein